MGKSELKKKSKKKDLDEVEAPVVESPAPKKKKKNKDEEASSEKKKKRKSEENEAEPVPSTEKKKKKKRKTEDEANSLTADTPVAQEESSKKKKKKDKGTDDKEEAVAVEEEVLIPVVAEVTNETGTTKVFVNNLPWSIDEAAMEAHFGKGKSIEWIEDRDTGRFKGMAVVEFSTTAEAEAAVAKSGQDLGGRTVYCRLDVKKAASPRPVKPKPEGCRKLFCGNLSYNIDDDAITKFFADAGSTVSYVKWVTDRDSGDFKGCGFVEFESTEMADKAIALQGASLLGRNVKLDWAEDRAKSW